MTPLYTQDDFNSAKPNSLLPLECELCSTAFYAIPKEIRKVLNNHKTVKLKFCSKDCSYKSRVTKQLIYCSNCNLEFEKQINQIKKSINNFCSRSCNVTYNNKNKTHGNRRSKLELWLEEELNTLYPNLPIDFNQKDAVGSELDIYIPSLNLAFELNGIFHYEPIFGTSKLNQTQLNDISKSKACFDNHIDLCVINTSQQKYFKPSTSQKYLDIIINIINERILLIS
jgi:hypothetical protein